MPRNDIEKARAEHTNELMALPNVVGVGTGRRDEQPVIKVFVERKLPREALAQDELVPAVVGGWPTDVEEIGVVTTATKAEAPGHIGGPPARP
jgi:hypothetical protein